MSAVLDDEVVADPIGVIVGLVAEVERGLTAGQIGDVVTAASGGRATRRRLAQSLKGNPQVLHTGRPPAILMTARLLLALRKAGAAAVSAPRCGGCMRELRYVRSLDGGDWGCSPCLERPRACAGCGEQRRAVTLDRHGQHRCQNCPDSEGDPLEELAQAVTALDPGMGRETIVAALRQATSRPAGQRRLAWAVVERPGLLSGAGTYAPSPAVLRFIDGLIAGRRHQSHQTRLAGRVPLKIIYLLVRRVLGLAVLVFRTDLAKDAELLVLRHENAVLRRRAGRVRYESASFDAVLQATGARILCTAVQAPRMNATCERLVGTLRRAVLDRMLILGGRHLHAVLTEYQVHYNTARHQGIAQRVPDDECGAPRATVTDIDTRQIRRKPAGSGAH